MRFRELLRRSFARSDVQTAWITSMALLFAVFVPGLLLYAYAAEESLEQFDRWFEYSLQVVVREIDEGGTAVIASDDGRGRLPNPDAAVRVRAPSGEIVYARGEWPSLDHQIQARLRDSGVAKRNLAAPWLLRHASWIAGEGVTASGARVELALPLRNLASLNAKIRRGVVVGAVIAAAVVLLIGLGTTMRAFAPLRRATAMLAEVGTGSLGVRLPSRGTGDPIDRHAETLNGVLERIDAAFARLRAFSSDAAHELRTPLNRISNVSEVALLEGNERDLRAALEAVHGTTEDLSRTVQALLLLAEIDERRLAIRPCKIELAPWIEQHVEVYAPSFEEAGISLAAECEDLAIEGDRVLLDRIVANLLDNALGHAPRGSRVEIRAGRRGDGVALTVDDAGPGIAEPDRERVFDRFARLAGGSGQGHGLGLALARAIAELHAGTLRVTRSPLGGARFELWLAQRVPGPVV
ncbi:MAG TPA: ATP-binding protein [Myxococcota bacterium]|nr:ATP-binding protein [Myxococcota bacterium]